MTGARYDNSVSLGNLLTIVALVVSVLGATVDIRERLVAIEQKVAPLWSAFIDDKGPVRYGYEH